MLSEVCSQGEVERRIWRTTLLITCRGPGYLIWAWGRSLKTGKYFDVAFEGSQPADWQQHSGTPCNSLALQGWCWQWCCRLCWCYLETYNKTFICLAILGREGKLLRYHLILTAFSFIPKLGDWGWDTGRRVKCYKLIDLC